MTQDNRTGPPQRWALVLLAIILALALLVLSLLDYAISARSAVGITVSVLLLGLLLILSIRIYRTERASLCTPPAPDDEISSASTRLILLALTLLALVLRLCQLGAESFWYDETYTALYSSRPAGVVLRGVSPLPHLVAHLSLWLGRSEFILRLGPALAGVLLIPATHLLGRTLYRRNEGLIAAGILTVSAYAIYHSQELRFYAWLMLFSTLTLAFLLRGLTGRRWLDWAGFTVAAVLNLYSHPFGLFVLASEGVYVVGSAVADSSAAHRGLPVGDRRLYAVLVRALIPPGICALLALIAFGPGWSHVSSLTSSPSWSVGSELAAVGIQRSSWLSTPIATWTYELPSSLLAVSHPALLAAILTVFFVGLLSSSRRQAGLVLVWFLIPPIVLLFVRVRFFHRYLSYFLPLFVIVAAHGIDYLGSMLRGRRQRLIAIALLTTLVAAPSLAQLPTYYRDTQKAQWREAIAFIEAGRQPGGLVLVTLNSIVGAPEQPFDWYRTVPDAELPWQFFPEEAALTDLAQLAQLPALTQGHERVWFLLPADSTEIKDGISSTLEGYFELVQVREFVHLEVLLYRAISPGAVP